MGGAGVGGHQRFCLARSHAARVRSRVAPGFAIHKPHTSNYPEFRSVDPLRTLPVYLKLTWVGWLGWLVRVLSVAIIMYDI